MTSVDLMEELAAEVRDAVKNFKFPAEYQAAKKISVYLFDLPTENFRDQTYYPMILIEHPTTTAREDDKLIAEIVLTFGIYQGEAAVGNAKEIQGDEGFVDCGDGWKDLENLSECVLARLLKKKFIGKKYRREGPAVWVRSEYQGDRFLFGFLTLNYELPHCPAPTVEDFYNMR